LTNDRRNQSLENRAFRFANNKFDLIWFTTENLFDSFEFESIRPIRLAYTWP